MDTNKEQTNSLQEVAKPKKLGPCCVCKETKKLRDECLLLKSQEECQT